MITSFTLLSTERKKDKDVYAWSASFKPLLRKLKRYAGNDKADDKIMSTIYYQPFIRQITSRELTILNSGGFLLDNDTKAAEEYEGEGREETDKSEDEASPPFDISALEEYCSRNSSQFPRAFHPNIKTNNYLRESKRGYDLITANLRSFAVITMVNAPRVTIIGNPQIMVIGSLKTMATGMNFHRRIHKIKKITIKNLQTSTTTW